MTIAVYPGSFDPLTAGHLSIIRQAVKMFSHVRVLLAVNPEKDYLLPLLDRVRLVEHQVEKIPNVSVDYTQGLVVDYARSIGAAYLVRGVRDVTDVVDELALARENKHRAPEIQTVFLPADPSVAGISSSKLKELIANEENVREWCDCLVEDAVRAAQTVKSNASIVSRKPPTKAVGSGKA